MTLSLPKLSLNLGPLLSVGIEFESGILGNFVSLVEYSRTARNSITFLTTKALLVT